MHKRHINYHKHIHRFKPAHRMRRLRPLQQSALPLHHMPPSCQIKEHLATQCGTTDGCNLSNSKAAAFEIMLRCKPFHKWTSDSNCSISQHQLICIVSLSRHGRTHLLINNTNKSTYLKSNVALLLPSSIFFTSRRGDNIPPPNKI